jgi:hypothetical protein
MKKIIIFVLIAFSAGVIYFARIEGQKEAETKARLDASAKLLAETKAKQAAEAEAIRKASPEYQSEQLQRRMKYTLRDSIRSHLKTTLVDYHGASNFEWSEPVQDGDNWKMRVVFRSANLLGGHATLARTYTCTSYGQVVSVTGL